MQLLNIAVLISGSGSNLQAIIDAVEKGEIKANLSLVISNKKDAYGLKRADKHGIKNYYIDKTYGDFDIQLMRLLEEEKIDLIVLAGY